MDIAFHIPHFICLILTIIWWIIKIILLLLALVGGWFIYDMMAHPLRLW